MATRNPRISVMLSDDHYRLLSEFARQQGISRSAAMSSIWAEAVPTVQRVVDLINEAGKAKEGIGDVVRRMAEEAQAEMLPHARAAVEQFDIFESRVKQEIERK